MNHAKTTVALLALLAIVLTPTAIADVGEWFNVPDGPPFFKGESYRICTADGVSPEGDRIYFGRAILQADAANDTGVQWSSAEGNGSEIEIHQLAWRSYATDSEDCIQVKLAGHGLATATEEHDYFFANYTDSALGGESRLLLIRAQERPTQDTNTTTATSLESSGLEQTGTALASIADKAVMLFWIALVVGFYWNGWLISGTFSLLGAFSLLATDWAFTEELAYGVALLGILLEVATNKLQPLRDRVDRFRRNSSPGGRL